MCVVLVDGYKANVQLLGIFSKWALCRFFLLFLFYAVYRFFGVYEYMLCSFFLLLLFPA